MRTLSGILAVAVLAALATACSSSGAGGRPIDITQRGNGCTPASVSVTPGEKLQLVVKNEASVDYEVEGIEGTKVEEVAVPSGLTRRVGFTVPSDGRTQKVKCYVPAGVSTIIEFRSAAVTGTAAPASPAPTVPSTPVVLQQPSATVAVALLDYSVTPDKTSVKPGVIRFIATNAASDQPHELAVLRRKPDGTLEKIDEVEGIAPGKGATLTLDLQPGAYVLACLIARGEGASTVDHYQAGMHAEFTVQ
ncbi:MAG TPA: hypothetical protein VEZ14_09530 [Dehalococcoidia bacterium]|nr:hypothetical protein [Dehalococcoidia bacterium]